MAERIMWIGIGVMAISLFLISKEMTYVYRSTKLNKALPMKEIDTYKTNKWQCLIKIGAVLFGISAIVTIIAAFFTSELGQRIIECLKE